jgi:hypothetical protein
MVVANVGRPCAIRAMALYSRLEDRGGGNAVSMKTVAESWRAAIGIVCVLALGNGRVAWLARHRAWQNGRARLEHVTR